MRLVICLCCILACSCAKGVPSKSDLDLALQRAATALYEGHYHDCMLLVNEAKTTHPTHPEPWLLSAACKVCMANQKRMDYERERRGLPPGYWDVLAESRAERSHASRLARNSGMSEECLQRLERLSSELAWSSLDLAVGKDGPAEATERIRQAARPKTLVAY